MQGMSSSRLYRRLALVLMVFGVALLLMVSFLAGRNYITSKNAPAPSIVDAAIAKQLSFVPFVPAPTVQRQDTVQISNQKYNAEQGTYSYILRHGNSVEYVVNEQASPANFAEIPDLFTKLVDGLGRYSSIETANGTYYLCRPKDGGEVAVLNERGVLMFIRTSSKPVRESEWRQVVAALALEKQ